MKFFIYLFLSFYSFAFATSKNIDTITIRDTKYGYVSETNLSQVGRSFYYTRNSNHLNQRLNKIALGKFNFHPNKKFNFKFKKLNLKYSFYLNQQKRLLKFNNKKTHSQYKRQFIINGNLIISSEIQDMVKNLISDIENYGKLKIVHGIIAKKSDLQWTYKERKKIKKCQSSFSVPCEISKFGFLY